MIERLFLTPEERQREIERICDEKCPGVGYAVLSGLMVKNGMFNVVLTTNFDDLVEDAVFLYRQKRPLVVRHEALAGFIRATRTRPLIVKLHGDQRLAPRTTRAETSELRDAIRQNVRTLLHDRGLIFIGYSGDDESVVQMLKGLPDESLPFGVYWVSDREPGGKLTPWLRQTNAIWVAEGDFDKLMLLIGEQFDIDLPTAQDIMEKYRSLYRDMSRLLDRQSESAVLREAIAHVDRRLQEWREYSPERRERK